ncbi:MAG: hypothetical protein ABIR81_08255 [Ginsengibacter sp.]
MPNQLSFEVEFTKGDIETILKDSNVERIVVSGVYEKTDKGWEAHASAQGVGSGGNLIQPAVPAPCIKPCP